VNLVERICRHLRPSYAMFDYNSSIQPVVKLSFDLSHILFHWAMIFFFFERDDKRRSFFWIRYYIRMGDT